MPLPNFFSDFYNSRTARTHYQKTFTAISVAESLPSSRPDGLPSRGASPSCALPSRCASPSKEAPSQVTSSDSMWRSYGLNPWGKAKRHASSSTSRFSPGKVQAKVAIRYAQKKVRQQEMEVEILNQVDICSGGSEVWSPNVSVGAGAGAGADPYRLIVETKERTRALRRRTVELVRKAERADAVRLEAERAQAERIEAERCALAASPVLPEAQAEHTENVVEQKFQGDQVPQASPSNENASSECTLAPESTQNQDECSSKKPGGRNDEVSELFEAGHSNGGSEDKKESPGVEDDHIIITDTTGEEAKADRKIDDSHKKSWNLMERRKILKQRVEKEASDWFDPSDPVPVGKTTSTHRRAISDDCAASSPTDSTRFANAVDQRSSNMDESQSKRPSRIKPSMDAGSKEPGSARTPRRSFKLSDSSEKESLDQPRADHPLAKPPRIGAASMSLSQTAKTGTASSSLSVSRTNSARKSRASTIQPPGLGQAAWTHNNVNELYKETRKMGAGTGQWLVTIEKDKSEQKVHLVGFDLTTKRSAKQVLSMDELQKIFAWAQLEEEDEKKKYKWLGDQLVCRPSDEDGSRWEIHIKDYDPQDKTPVKFEDFTILSEFREIYSTRRSQHLTQTAQQGTFNPTFEKPQPAPSATQSTSVDVWKERLKPMWERLGIHEVVLDVLREHFNRLDKNGDGGVDMTEFTGLLEWLGIDQRESGIMQKKRMFEEFDSIVKDKRIDFEEFVTWLADKNPSLRNLSQAEAEKLVRNGIQSRVNSR